MKGTSSISDLQLAAVNTANSVYGVAGALNKTMPSVSGMLVGLGNTIRNEFDRIATLAKCRHLDGKSDVALAISYAYCMQNGLIVPGQSYGIDLACPRFSTTGVSLSDRLPADYRKVVGNILLLAKLAAGAKSSNDFGHIPISQRDGVMVECGRSSILMQHWNSHWTVQVRIDASGGVIVDVECNYEPFNHIATPFDVGLTTDYLDTHISVLSERLGGIPPVIHDAELSGYFDPNDIARTLEVSGDNYTLSARLLKDTADYITVSLNIPEFDVNYRAVAWDTIPAVLQHLVVKHLNENTEPVGESQ